MGEQQTAKGMSEKIDNPMKRIKVLITENRRLRIKQTAWIEALCHLRSRIDQTERHIKDNDKEIKKLRQSIYDFRQA
jgi:hypothetical protein